MEHEKRVRRLMDWCRRDPHMGEAQLECETPEMAREVRERLERGPQQAPSVWEAFREMRAERAKRKGKE